MMSESAKQFVIKMSAPQNMNIGEHPNNMNLILLMEVFFFYYSFAGALNTKGRGVEKNGSIFARASLQCHLTECEGEQDKVDYSGTNSQLFSVQSHRQRESLEMSVLLGLTTISMMFRMMQMTVGVW